ncbi:MAG: glycosyltransferase family A protein [Candidatus Roizmanbacteria bacterium]|nr:glycosyltransferase family A protein [Candidatus Roizmanbacteria bacterium]
MNAPSISIIIPAYNEENYLHECLVSVFKQDPLFSYEVIVVDNNSKDRTYEVASTWKEKGIQLVSELRPGATIARNTGARVARAEILYFLDADCRLPPDALKKIMNVFTNNTSCQLVSGPYIYDRDGFIPKLATDTFHYFSLYHHVIKLLFGIYQFPGGNFAIKKKSFDTVGGFDETICNQEIILPDDLDLALRLQKDHTFNVLFKREYAVSSSFRRVKKSPIKHTLVRFFATLKLLLNKENLK